MRRLAIASLLLLGCFDWDVLSSTLGEQDFSVSSDLSVFDLAQTDLAQPDLAQPDLRMPDLAMPDLMPPTLSFTKQADAAGLGNKKANNAIFGYSAMHITAVGDGGVVARTTNGKDWSIVTLAATTTQNLSDVWFLDEKVGWIVGMGSTAYQWDGSTWVVKAANLTNDVQAVFGSAANKVVAAGSADAVFRFDGTNWTKSTNIAPKPGTQYGMWGTGLTFFSVGASNDTLNINDVTQVRVASDQGGGTVFRSVWGTSATNILAVGYDGNTAIASKSNGVLWTKLNNVPTVGKLYAVWGVSATEIWVGGENGQVMQYNDNTKVWSRFTVSGIPSNEIIKDIWAFDAANVWFVTDAGGIYKKN